jgi:hypothetical protein
MRFFLLVFSLIFFHIFITKADFYDEFFGYPNRINIEFSRNPNNEMNNLKILFGMFWYEDNEEQAYEFESETQGYSTNAKFSSRFK